MDPHNTVKQAVAGWPNSTTPPTNCMHHDSFRYFALTYGTSFAILTATIVTVILYHKDDILSALPFDTPYTPAHARSGRADRDIHVQKSEATYEPVPGSWYAYIGCTMVAAAIIVVTCYPMQLPVWALLLSLVVALIFLPACGIIAATSGTVIGEFKRPHQGVKVYGDTYQAMPKSTA